MPAGSEAGKTVIDLHFVTYNEFHILKSSETPKQTQRPLPPAQAFRGLPNGFALGKDFGITPPLRADPFQSRCLSFLLSRFDGANRRAA